MKIKILILFILVLLFVFPIIILLLYTFSSSWVFPDIFPKNYDTRSLLFFTNNADKILLSIFSSFLYSITVVFLTFIFTVLPASVFARYDFKFKSFFEGILLAPALLPSMIFSMGIHYIFLKINISDSFLGIVLVLTIFSYPYMLRALIAGFISFGEKYSICARNLGAKGFDILLRIEFPLLLPSIVAGGTVVFLVSFSEYFLVFLIGGGSISSYSGYIFSYLNSSDRSIASLLTLVFLIVPIFLFLIIDRFIFYYYRKRNLIKIS